MIHLTNNIMKADEEIYTLTEEEIQLINERAARILEEERKHEERKRKESEYIGVIETYLATFKGWDGVYKREVIYSCWIQKVAKYTAGNIFWIADIQCANMKQINHYNINKITPSMVVELREWSNSILYRHRARSYVVITDRFLSFQEAKNHLRRCIRTRNLLPKYKRLTWYKVYDFMDESIAEKDYALY